MQVKPVPYTSLIQTYLVEGGNFIFCCQFVTSSLLRKFLIIDCNVE